MLVFTIPSWYKSHSYPEGSIFIYEQMQALREIGDDIIVLAIEPISIKSSIHASKKITIENDNGIITYRTQINALFPSKLRWQYIYTYKKALKRLINQAINDYGRPDVLYAHFSYPAGCVAVDFSNKLNIPLVTEEHYSGLMRKNIDKSLLNCVNKTINGSKSFIAVSGGLKRSIEEKLNKNTNIKVISNMINDCFFFREPITHEGFIFFACGSLIVRKGFVELIVAFSQEFKGNNKVKLRIGGSGEQKQELEKLINNLDMRNQISLIGQLSREETLQEYINCDCFVLPSKAETYGLVYREAMAVGRPIISTRHGGFADDDWHDEYGKLIPIDNESSLRSAMREVYENYVDYDLKTISDLCLRDCSKTSIARLIHNELEHAIK